MKRLRTLLGIGLGLAVVVGAGWYFASSRTASNGPAGRPNMANQPVTVGLATVAKGDIPLVTRALGTVTPLATVTVKTQITGQLMQVAFTEGQAVKKGDLLAVVDPRPYEVALQQAIGTLDKDEALLKNAQLDLTRYQKLVAQDSVARQTYDTQASLVRQYEATVVTDRAAVDAAKLNLVYTRIIAPTDGRIGLRLVDAGNYVTIGDSTGICVITLMKPMSVVFSIPEDSLPPVRKRLREGATLQATALDRAQKIELGVGKLETTDNQIDTTTGTVKLRATFDNSDEALFPNQFVNIRLLVDTVKDALVVPVAAIQKGQPGTFVYRVKPDDTVEIRVVETGASDGDRIAITKGLALNDQVVVDGTDRLRDGSKIRRPPPAGAPVAAAPPEGAGASGRDAGADGAPGPGRGAGRRGQSSN
ncbi:membrane fusion protein, multidrug efflux system [Enhydrobacter aerosaccus]|uniref:Membrane fusion protein, multidrug efflux system n=1 Tax=Enhydrobacter aerosaccus TaxID=225324 RepID=A0A1T4PR53_9HYPH|nr:MdtA/MuxA family multidrug efflux RND transporter periplasmic adaptor subunit [Enhydrobacter aerosaccus]SJZ93378.1 membrane fusion protein, multidrug efflux system [Enhydrobacter aerosaccus]